MDGSSLALIRWSHFCPHFVALDAGKGLGGLLNSLPSTNVIRCDEAAWRLGGISLAGWNVAVSLLVLATSLRAAAESLRSR